MTDEEATKKLELLWGAYCYGCEKSRTGCRPGTCEVNKAYTKAIEALQLTTPTVPELVIFEGDEYWRCPNCGHKEFDESRPAYCDKCGQAFDWSEEALAAVEPIVFSFE